MRPARLGPARARPARPPAGAPPAARLLIASFNPGKAREIARLIGAAGFSTLTLRDAGIVAPYDEHDATYEANALGKARHYAALAGLAAVADDSGIEVDALGGRPGVQSARYGGDGLDDAGRLRLLLSELAGVAEARRVARYVAVAVVARPDGEARAFRGVCEGSIAMAPRGDGGFGYDPVFHYPPFAATFGETPEEKKNRVSHRGMAFRALAEFLLTGEGRRFLAPSTR